MAVEACVVSPRTIFTVAIVCAVTFFVNVCLDDVLNHGRVSILHWSPRLYEPAHLVNVLSLWLGCNACVFAASGGFQVWRRGWTTLNKIGAGALWNGGWITAAVLLHTAMFVLPSWAAYELDLPGAAIFALCFEQIRLLMKSISYLREHVRAALELRDSNDSLGHLAYFLFAPTLKYRNVYERTPRVRWGVAAAHFAVFLLAIFTIVVGMSRGALRPFCGGADGVFLDASPLLGWPRFALQVGTITLRAWPVGIVLIVGTPMALHSWNVVFAELLRYPSHGFSQPWWNATSYSGFFHHWNTFVRAWLHTYVFRKLQARGYSANESKVIIICLSAIWHEYMLATSLGFLIPWFFVFFSSGGAFLIYDPLKIQKGMRGNIFLLLSFCFGNATFVAFYFLESTARAQCGRTMELPWDLFVPRSLTCDYTFKNCTTF